MKDVFQWIWKLRNNTPSVLFVFLLFTLVEQSFQRDKLTEDELQQVFGSWRPSASEYTLFRPKISKPLVRRKRDASVDDASLFEFNALGETFRFRIEPVVELISPKFALLGRNGSDSYFLNKRVKNCAFQGRDERQSSRTIALVMCGNLRGVVTSPAEELVIEPLPESISKQGRFRRSSKHRISEHIIYRRKALSSCPLKEGLPQSPSLDHRERDYLHSRYSSQLINHYNPENEKDTRLYSKETATMDEKDSYRSKDTYFIETAVFVDRDLLKHMQTNFPSNTEEEVIQVVLAMVNAVQLLYNDPSLGYNIKYVLKRLELLYQDPRGLSRPHDIDDFLTKFCSWQHLENPVQDVDPFHWDHALILTGLDLYTVIEGGKINSQVVGLAPVAGMCTRTSSCTVNEGRHFESVYVVAHEIGHNLGMRHDGLQSGNNCDPSGYLMSPTLGSGKVTWSHCSKKYFTKFLESPQSECLRDEPLRPPRELDHEGRILPGQRFSADQQCMLKYGVGSRSSTSQKPDEICRDLHCIRDQYTWTSHPALEGTQCGKDMWCSRGYCVDEPRSMNLYASEEAISFLPISSSNSASPSIDTTTSLTNGGVAGEWGRWSECQSSCIYGIDGILSSGSTGLSASKKQCHSCQAEYRYRSCSAARECSVRQKKTIQDFADEVCSRLIREDPSLTGNSVLLPVNGIQSCLVECKSINRSPVTTRIPFPDGTVCHSSATNYPTYCISGYCTEFRCEPNSLYGAGPHICRSNSLPQPGPLPSPIESTPGRFSPSPPSQSLGQQSVEAITDSSMIGEQSWSPWVVSSECRFSCISQSKGIQLVSRDCLHVYGCNGLNRNIRLCTPKQTQGCANVQSPFTYANEICQKYSKSVKQLSGFGMQLSSTSEDPNRACTVACQDVSLKYRFYKVNGKDGWFPFGTECSSDKNGFDAYCLNGKCLEFNADGTPLRNKGGQLVTRNKSRALELFAPIPLLRGFSTLKHIGDNLAEAHWLVKRDVKTTSHRLPGSFEDSFILSLIDEINATFIGNISSKTALNSTVDLENPLFFGGVPNASAVNVSDTAETKSISKPLVDIENYTWLSTSSYCSATCNEGIVVHTYYCVDGKKNIVDDNLCSNFDRPLTIQSCSAGVRCEKSMGDKKPNSPFERWLVGLVDEIKSTVH